MTFLARRNFVLSSAMAAALLAASSFTPAFASSTKHPAPGIISLSAQGSASVAPDMALISLTVLREAKTAREALDANNKAMSQVLDAMKKQGIAERDLQTGAFSIQPKWVYPNAQNTDNKPPYISGYTVTNTLDVRIRDLSQVGAILDTSVKLGVNQGGNVIFTNDDKDKIYETARLDALAKVKAKAQTMTKALGVGLGRIIKISETAQNNRPMPMMKAEMALASDARSAVPVASGENEYHVSVNVTWEIAQ